MDLPHRLSHYILSHVCAESLMTDTLDRTPEHLMCEPPSAGKKSYEHLQINELYAYKSLLMHLKPTSNKMCL